MHQGTLQWNSGTQDIYYKEREREKASPLRNAQASEQDFSLAVLETRNQWSNNFKILKKKLFQFTILLLDKSNQQWGF